MHCACSLPPRAPSPPGRSSFRSRHTPTAEANRAATSSARCPVATFRRSTRLFGDFFTIDMTVAGAARVGHRHLDRVRLLPRCPEHGLRDRSDWVVRARGTFPTHESLAHRRRSFAVHAGVQVTCTGPATASPFGAATPRSVRISIGGFSQWCRAH